MSRPAPEHALVQSNNSSSPAESAANFTTWKIQAALLGQTAKAQVSDLVQSVAGAVARGIASTTAALQQQQQQPSQTMEVEAVDSESTEPSVDQSASVLEVLETPDLLLLVFSSISTGHLLASVASVCRVWREVATSPQLWQEHCDPKLPALLAAYNREAAGSDCPRMSSCYLALHHFNFLRHPNFQDVRFIGQGDLTGRSGWWTRQQGGNGFSYEPHPQGITGPPPAPAALYPPHASNVNENSIAHRVRKAVTGFLLPPAHHVDGCIATSFDWTELVQVVDLHAELRARGLTSAQATMLLDAGLILGFSVQVGARADCGGAVQVVLSVDEGGPLPNMQAFVAGPKRHHFFSGRLRTQRDAWQRYAYTVALPRGARQAIVVLRGRDTQFWQGFYGAKFAAAELRFIASEAEFGAAECLEQWKEVHGAEHP